MTSNQRMKRLTKDQWFIRLARTVAQRSTCIRRNYGAIIVTPRDEIVATGYNGAPRGQPHCSDHNQCKRKALGIPPGERYELCVAVHAEMNAMIQAGRLAEGCIMYIAGRYPDESLIVPQARPCLLCSRVMVNAGIALVVYELDFGEYCSVTPEDLLKEISMECV